MKAVILAGGHGKRLKPYTLFLPKPMLPLGNKPILSYIIKWLKEQKINDIILSVSYLNKPIEEYFRDGKEFKVKIKYIRSKKPLGTAGQLKKAEALLDDTFVCLYADAILDFKLNNAIKFHKKNKSLATMILQEYKTKLIKTPEEWICKYSSDFKENLTLNKIYRDKFKTDYMILGDVHKYIKVVHFTGPGKTIHEHNESFIKENWRE